MPHTLTQRLILSLFFFFSDEEYEEEEEEEEYEEEVQTNPDEYEIFSPPIPQAPPISLQARFIGTRGWLGGQFYS